MREDKQSFVDKDELTDADLDQVSGGNTKPIVKPKPKPTTVNSGGGGLGGIQGESTNDKHNGSIEILS